MKNSQIVAIILAAGESSRLYREGIRTPKPMLPIGRGTFLTQALNNCKGICDTIVVLGYRASDLKIYCRKIRTKFCVNENYRRGQTSSLKCGIKHLPPDAAGFLIYPVDYPLVKKSTVKALVEAFARNKKRIVSPHCMGRGGHPVVVPASLREEFLALGDDQPARDVIYKNKERVLRVEVDDPGISRDVDTIDDYAVVLGRKR